MAAAKPKRLARAELVKQLKMLEPRELISIFNELCIDRNTPAFASTVAELYTAEQIGVADEAYVAAGAVLAALLDLAPLNTDLWREYRMILNRLAADDDNEGEDENSETKKLLEDLAESR